ncbi:MAG: DUF1207 domain-containing protein [Gemmatimonadota bacterium]
MRASLRTAVVAAGAALVPLLAAPLSAQDATQDSYPDRCGAGMPRSEQAGYVPLPRGDVFCPLIADPKAQRSFASLLQERTGSGTGGASSRLASVGIGDVFGLGRWSGSQPGDGVQLSLSAGVFAQFDLGTSSYDLLNADYMVGLPLTIRRGRGSMRLRVYHQSSHLGDEYLLREPADRRDRENLSFESIDLLLSLDAGALRFYGGGERLVNREPEELAATVVHAGTEFRPMTWIIPLRSLGGFRFIAAVDAKTSDEHDWKPSISARAGLEYDRRKGGDLPGRRWALLAEFYEGPSPYGQFFRERVQYAGVGVHFGGF